MSFGIELRKSGIEINFCFQAVPNMFTILIQT